MGCISSIPVIPPESVTSTIEVPVVALTDYDSFAQNSLLERIGIPSLDLSGFDLSLRYHQLLI